MEVNVNMNVFFSFWKGRDWDSRIIRMNYLQLLILLSILLIQTNFMMQILGVAWWGAKSWQVNNWCLCCIW